MRKIVDILTEAEKKEMLSCSIERVIKQSLHLLDSEPDAIEPDYEELDANIQDLQAVKGIIDKLWQVGREEILKATSEGQIEVIYQDISNNMSPEMCAVRKHLIDNSELVAAIKAYRKQATEYVGLRECKSACDKYRYEVDEHIRKELGDR